jgi:hypothetical protein
VSEPRSAARGVILCFAAPKARRVTTTEARIIACLDALRRNRGSEEQLGQLIQEELDRSPAGERDELLGYFERWLERPCWRSGRRRAARFNSVPLAIGWRNSKGGT